MSDLGNQPEEEKLSEVQELSVEEVVGTIKRCQGSNIKFTFLLGSGASVSSGIPTGGELAQKWYKELEQDLPKNRFEAWQKLKECKGVEDENRRAEFYSPIYEKRFGHIPEEGYNELKKIMEGKDPSLGYFILAQIISKTRNNIVLTTNFDNLLEDAVRSYTEKTPFVAGHELLADHITSHTDRPIIIKLHRDLLLHPCNTMEETGKLPQQWEKNLRNILSSSTLIVLGYGGNDGSLMNFLEGLPLAQRKGIYWCVRNLEDLAPRIREVLKKDSDRVVLIKDFDDFMYRCAVQLEYKNQFQDIVHISKIRDYPKVIEPLLRRLRKIYYKLGSLLRSLRDKEKIPDYLQQLLLEIYKETYTILVNAGKEEKSDPKKADEIYRCGIDQDSDNPFLLGAYADFLSNICQDYDRAEQYYKRAIEADPNHVNTLGNYASFLKDIRKDYDKAEEYYKRALDADPQNATTLGNYANLLCDIRKDYDKAEEHYLRALEIEPNNPVILRNYAIFLRDIRKDEARANEYFKRAEVEQSEGA